LKAVFPVEFQFLDPESGGSVSDIKQAFTKDIGKGGICLEVNNVEEGFEEILRQKKLRLDLRLHVPAAHKETKAIATIAWHKKIKTGYPNKYLIGLSFLQIDPKESDRIFSHARIMSLTPKVTLILILFLIAGLGYFFISDFMLKRENKRLVQESVQLSGKKSELEKDILGFDGEYKKVAKRLLENEEAVEEYEEKIKELNILSMELKKKDELLESFEQDKNEAKEKLKEAVLEKQGLSRKVDDLLEEAAYLKGRVSELSKERAKVEVSLKELLPSFEVAEEKSISSMYRWVKNRQNKLTGLVVSYTSDKGLEDWAFTYEESLASQSFILMGDQRNAQEIFDFYKEKAKKIHGGFANAYDAYTGLVLEEDVSIGPNIWLGIAILQYTNKFKDKEYVSLAEDIGKWLIVLQEEDSDFGLRTGPKTDGFSIEHNLDAYAFFGMLYKITKERNFLKAQKESLGWIKEKISSRTGEILKRAGDASVSTDTFLWAVAAIGPDVMKEQDIDPDKIIDLAEKDCLVTTYYIRPNGDKLEVTGFDSEKYEYLSRGGVVSAEWSCRMVVVFKIMAEYHAAMNNLIKASAYERKADFYLSELGKMVISSHSGIGQSEGCLPYATQDNVDTGHGWKIERASTTGSIAGTVYAILAKYNYNPLVLE